MNIKNLKINKKVGAVLIAGCIIVGSGAGYNVHAKGSTYCELDSTPVAELLKNEEIMKNTTIDEELEKENIDIVRQDEEFRYHASLLTYDNYKNDRENYDYNLKWCKENYKDTVLDIMFAAGKGAVSDALEVDMDDVKLRVQILDKENGPEVYVEDESNYPFITKLDNKSKPLEKLVSKIANVQDNDFDLDNAKDIKKAYDDAMNKANMVIATGINRQDDNLKPKYSKKYVKKNIIKK